MQLLYIIFPENKEKQNVVSSHFYTESEVIHMLEAALLQLLILSLITNIALAIISFILIIAFVIVTYKENHISASH